MLPVYVKDSVLSIGINDLGFLAKDLILMPNPAHQFVIVHSHLQHLITSYAIKDPVGRVLEKAVFNEKIPLDKLATGLYFIEFNDEQNNRLAIKKIIVE